MRKALLALMLFLALPGSAKVDDDVIKVKKEIEISGVSPEITYEYEITPYRNGDPKGGIYVYSNPSFKLDGGRGQKVRSNILLKVDESKFTHQGIYKYVLSDVTDEKALAFAGISRDKDFETERYILLYIADKGEGLEFSSISLVNPDGNNTIGYVIDSSAKHDYIETMTAAELVCRKALKGFSIRV